MLQMLNVDVKKSNDPHVNAHHSEAEGSDDELRRSHSNYNKKELVLPLVKSHNGQTLNMSADNIKTEESQDKVVEEKSDPYKPRMYIYI